MLRLVLLCVLALAMSAMVAWGSPMTERSAATNSLSVGPHALTQSTSQRAKRTRRRVGRTHHHRTTSRHARPHAVLFGDRALEPKLVRDVTGLPDAFPFTDSATGSASSITVYVAARTRATRLVAGLYAAKAGRPGALVAVGSLRFPRANAWDSVRIRHTSIKPGTYWLAVLGRGGALYVRARGRGPCRSQNNHRGHLVVLRSSWQPGRTRRACPVSAYVVGTRAQPNGTIARTRPPAGPPTRGGTTDLTFTGSSSPGVPSGGAAPVNTAAPTISGSALAGNTLTASVGTWASGPASYAYKWQRCAASGLGAVCTDIAGAASNTYLLTDSDVGYTVRVVVTAANSSGSTPATSAETGVVATPPPADTARPLITGSPVEGETLSTSAGVWSNNPTYSYIWQDCDTSGNNCTVISNATTSSYTLGNADVGHTMRSVVTACNGGACTSASSGATRTITSSTPIQPQVQTEDCFSSPGECGYPDPAAVYSGGVAPSGDWNTGGTGVGLDPYTDSPSGTTACSSLATQHTGNLTITSNLSNTNVINGQIVVAAPNLTINNVCVTYTHVAMNGAVSQAAIYLNGESNTTIENSIVRGGGTNGGSGSVEIAVGGSTSGEVLSHDYVYYCGECIWGPGYTVSDSYIVNNGDYGVGEHLEALYVSDGIETLNHNTLLQPADTIDSSPAYSAVLIGDTHYHAGGPCDNTWTITNNLLAGSGEVFSLCGNATSVGTSAMAVTGNHIARCLTPPLTGQGSGGYTCGTTDNAGQDAYGYWPYGGYFGIAGAQYNPIYCPPTSGQTWSGNVYDDNLSTVSCGGLDQAGGLPSVATAAPTLTGTAQVGQTLSASNASWQSGTGVPAPTSFSWQWEYCDSSGGSCQAIPGATCSGATGCTYTIASTYTGDAIAVAETATNKYGPETSTSTATSAVTSGPTGGQTENCFSSPGACGYPDPNYQGGNVGVSNCSALAHQLPSSPAPTTAQLNAALGAGSYYYSGSGNLLEIASDNVNWSNVNFENWQIDVGAGQASLTLNDDCVSFVGSTSNPTIIVDQAATPATGETHTLTLTNSTIYASNPNALQEANAVAAPANSVLDNDYIYNTFDAVSVGGASTIENSYINSNENVPGAHTEPVYTEPGAAGLTIHHNVLLNAQTQTAEIFGQSGGGSCTNNFTITNNLLAGGGYVLYECSGASSQGTSTLTFERNDIARCLGGSTRGADGGNYCGTSDPSSSGTSIGYGADTHGYWPGGAHFGIDSLTYCGGSTVWAGNYWDDNGTTVSCN